MYTALASRRGGPGEQAVGLDARVACLQAALLQVWKVWGRSGWQAVSLDARVACLQTDLLQVVLSVG